MTPNDTAALETAINAAWEDRASLSPETKGEARDAIETAIASLDNGTFRVASKAGNGDWTVHQWLKKAVLLGFRIHPNAVMTGGPQDGHFYDKVPSKFEGWTEADFAKAAFRVVPPATVRRGSFIAPNAVLMPSYVNIGAHVGSGTMVDTWATVGSCAQIGENVHLSGGVGIGVEDNCLKIIASSARALKLLKASSSAKAPSSLWVSSSASPRKSSTARQATLATEKSLPIPLLCRAHYRPKTEATASLAR